MEYSATLERRIANAMLTLATALLTVHVTVAVYQVWAFDMVPFRILAGLTALSLVWVTIGVLRRRAKAKLVAASVLIASAIVLSFPPTGTSWRFGLLVFLDLVAGTYLGASALLRFGRADLLASSKRWQLVILAALPIVIGLNFVFGLFAVRPWLAYLAAGVGILLVARKIQSRVFPRFAGLFARRPDELSGRVWRQFRKAYWYRAIGDMQKAAASIPTSGEVHSTVLILDGLVRLDEARRSPPLKRLIYEADYVPTFDERAELEATTIELESATAWVSERNQLIESLVYASASARRFYGAELDNALLSLTMQRFDQEAEKSFQGWWERTQAGTSSGGELPWLIARLWEAGCTESALDVADNAEQREWSEILAVARLVESASADGEALAPVVYEYAEAACLVPMMSEWAGLYLLDSAIAVERGAAFVARRLKDRGRVIATLRKIWEDFEDCCSIRPATLLAVLTGYRSGLFVSRRGFDRWWAKNRDKSEAYESQLAAGLEWASIQDWQAAEKAFEKAHRLSSGSASARYNRAFCFIQLDELPTAERLLGDLVRDEPDEALWWVRLGDTRRLMQENIGALTAYRRAVELIGDTPDLISRLVTVLVEEGRENEARELLRATTLDDTEKGVLLGQATAVSANSGHDLESWLPKPDDDDTPPTVH